MDSSVKAPHLSLSPPNVNSSVQPHIPMNTPELGSSFHSWFPSSLLDSNLEADVATMRGGFVRTSNLQWRRRNGGSKPAKRVRRHWLTVFAKFMKGAGWPSPAAGPA